MRGLLGLLWIMLGLGALIFHYGPGVDYRAADAAGRNARRAFQAERRGDWVTAVEAYDEALATLPESHRTAAYSLRLAKAKAQIMASQLPDAREALHALWNELSDHADVDVRLLNDVRSALASSQYYMTWLMRLEGAAKDEWEPEIESARQHYRALVETAEVTSDTEVREIALQDLESAIRLARMDLNELQALPLPCQCRGCCSVKCRGLGKRPNEKESKRAGFMELGDHIGS